jgi:ribose transport system substrate-binding protein
MSSSEGGGGQRFRARVIAVIVALGVAAGVAISAGAAGSGLPTTAAQEIATTGITTDKSFCGTKQITLGVEDGFGLNTWSQASYAAVRSEAAKCPNVKTITLAGGGDLNKMIADVNSLVAQGANAIVIIPDYGKAELQALQAATAQGVKVVPWGADPGGVNGKDYVQYVDWDAPASGTLWAQWMAEALHGKGNVIFTGGPAGNAVGQGQLKNIVKVFAKYPGIKLLTGKNAFGVTNWDPATAQKLGAALVAKYPKIDGVITNFGTDALGIIRAFQAAGRKLVPTEGLDANGLSCLYKSTRKTQPQFQTANFSNRNWMGRIAARKAIAAAEGIKNTEPAFFALPFYEDTLHGKVGKCDPKAGLDFYWSNNISPATVAKYGKP